jgi:hypothetical protein
MIGSPNTLDIVSQQAVGAAQPWHQPPTTKAFFTSWTRLRFLYRIQHVKQPETFSRV